MPDQAEAAPAIHLGWISRLALMTWMAMLVATFVLVAMPTDGQLAARMPQAVLDVRAVVLPWFNAALAVR